MRIFPICVVLIAWAANSLYAEDLVRLKELVSVEGVRDNQLVGYGLAVGLNGTGDKRQTVFSTQSLSNLLERMGTSVPATSFQVRNTAAVLITATLPPYAQTGTRIDVTVAAIGDAASLQGGLLILTPLQGPDGQVFAVAQGPVVTGGFIAGRGGGGNSQTVNHPTVGRIVAGALVEKSAPSAAVDEGKIHLELRKTDFTTAARIAEAVNRKFSKPPAARAENAARVTVSIPAEYRDRTVEFMAQLESITLEADHVSKIVINERTGTIVMGRNVQLQPVSIMQGGLTVEIEIQPHVSQPAPLSGGQTVVTPQTKVTTKEEKAKAITLKQGATVEELVKALQAIGSTARDIIAILQNLKVAGSLDAEIEVI
ncbi:MAG TPA: flagellar basal body P-ring protein FlgI [Bryobacteraceae bacterium]|jgi:flagellar P-ring protein precursor FlgI